MAKFSVNAFFEIEAEDQWQAKERVEAAVSKAVTKKSGIKAWGITGTDEEDEDDE